MQRMISIPLQSTSTINIHVPLGDVIGRQQQANGHVSRQSYENGGNASGGGDLQHHVTRMSITSNGSSIVSVSPPSTPRHSRSGSYASPPSTPVSPSYVNGAGAAHEEGLDTDSAVGSSHDDSRSVHSTGSAGADTGSVVTSSVGVMDDSDNNNSADDTGHCAVALFVDKQMAVLIKATCQTEAACVDQRFVKIMLAVIHACGLHLKKSSQEEEFTAATVNQMKLADGRAAEEHTAELSRVIDSSVSIRHAICRRFHHNSKTHVGTLVHDVVKAEGACTIAKVGALVELRKCSKYAPAREFADQLCEHIYATKPRRLGSRDKALELQKLKTNFRGQLSHKVHVARDDLLSQTFIFDPTINVAEAARRSFVEVLDFALFE